MHGDAAERFRLMTLPRGGDCDSEPLLLAVLIRSVDRHLPLALINVRAPDSRVAVAGDHTILAVGVPPGPDERTLRCGSGALTLIETTDDWGIGRPSDDTDL